MNGSKNMTYRDSVCFIFMLCFMTPIFAEEQTADKEMPSADFLEFLGEWETIDGEWIDPVVLENEEIGKLIETVNETTIETTNETDNEK